MDEIKVRIAFTVKRGYISEIDFALQLESGEKIRVEIEITDPNKTRISTSELKKVRNAAEDLIEENTCRECGELLFYYDEGDHGDCKECGAHGYIGYNGNVCWDCDRKPDYSYAGYGYCCNCRSYEEVYYSHYNKKMCEDCVEDDYYYSSNYGYCYNCGDYEYLYSSGKCYYCY